MPTPNSATPRFAAAIYLTLVGLTVLTWAIGRAGLSGLGISLLVLGIALFKGHLVGDFFMGLGGVRGWWRWVIVIWLLLPGILIGVAFALSGEG